MCLVLESIALTALSVLCFGMLLTFETVTVNMRVNFVTIGLQTHFPDCSFRKYC